MVISIRGERSSEAGAILVEIARKYLPHTTIDVVDEYEIDVNTFIMLLSQCNIVGKYYDTVYCAKIEYNIVNKILLAYRSGNKYRLVVAVFKR